MEMVSPPPEDLTRLDADEALAPTAHWSFVAQEVMASDLSAADLAQRIAAQLPPPFRSGLFLDFLLACFGIAAQPSGDERSDDRSSGMFTVSSLLSHPFLGESQQSWRSVDKGLEAWSNPEPATAQASHSQGFAGASFQSSSTSSLLSLGSDRRDRPDGPGQRPSHTVERPAKHSADRTLAQRAFLRKLSRQPAKGTPVVQEEPAVQPPAAATAVKFLATTEVGNVDEEEPDLQAARDMAYRLMQERRRIAFLLSDPDTPRTANNNAEWPTGR